MADNESGDLNSTLNDSDDIMNPFITVEWVLNYIQSGMSFVTFIYGVTSWYLIRKFRSFNNYVYLSAILVNLLRLTVLWILIVLFFRNSHFYNKFNHLLGYIFLYLTTVYNYWVVIMCYMFYKDIVKVFDISIKKKYLFSTLFAWGVPLIVFLICKLIFFFMESGANDKVVVWSVVVLLAAYICCSILPTVLNVVLFIKLVFALYPCNNKNAAAISKKERRKQNLSRLCTATAMFLLCNVFVATFLLWELLEFSHLISTFTLNIQIIVLALFVPLVKSNRAVWHEYYKNRLNRSMS